MTFIHTAARNRWNRLGEQLKCFQMTSHGKRPASPWRAWQIPRKTGGKQKQELKTASLQWSPIPTQQWDHWEFNKARLTNKAKTNHHAKHVTMTTGHKGPVELTQPRGHNVPVIVLKTASSWRGRTNTIPIWNFIAIPPLRVCLRPWQTVGVANCLAKVYTMDSRWHCAFWHQCQQLATYLVTIAMKSFLPGAAQMNSQYGHQNGCGGHFSNTTTFAAYFQTIKQKSKHG